MAVKQEVLARLADARGQALSGEGLAEVLGVSRAAVWKAVKELQKEGHIIQAAPNKGYTLSRESEVLCPEAIRPWLKTQQVTVVAEKCVSSTNLTAKQLAADGAPHGSLVVADTQTAGRGRRGRSFSSPPGTGLYLSAVLRSSLPMGTAALITSAAAVAACRAFQRLYGKELAIKWVNDLYWQGKKCCGILTEAATDMESGGVEYLVVGMGFNLYEPKSGFAPEIRQVAGAIFDQEEQVSRCRLAAEIVNELLDLCDQLPGTAFLEEYRARNLVPGKDILLLQNGEQRLAHALGITDQGHLLVRTQDGEEEISFGEVSVRFE